MPSVDPCHVSERGTHLHASRASHSSFSHHHTWLAICIRQIVAVTVTVSSDSSCRSMDADIWQVQTWALWTHTPTPKYKPKRKQAARTPSKTVTWRTVKGHMSRALCAQQHPAPRIGKWHPSPYAWCCLVFLLVLAHLINRFRAAKKTAAQVRPSTRGSYWVLR